MRLTLRTMLAYLDEILDPHDAEQLRTKIEDSEFATSLVHQIRGSVRRLRLDAPALDATGIGGDLNSVAEYLDNVLPPEQVPALEKACLENEVNLGEVASCHQVLTLVLGEPANVSDRMRQRCYGIAATTDPAEHLRAHSAHRAVPKPAGMNHAEAPAQTTSASSSQEAQASADLAEFMEASAAPPVRRQVERPSEKFAKPSQQPSTREAWRAESLANSDQFDHELQAQSSTTTAAPAAPIEPEIANSSRPSLLRTAVLGGVIVLLIASGLLFATGALDRNRLIQWLGNRQTVVDRNDVEAGDSDPSEASIPATPSDPDGASHLEPSDIASVELQSATPSLPQQPLPDPTLNTSPPEPLEANHQTVDRNPQSEDSVDELPNVGRFVNNPDSSDTIESPQILTDASTDASVPPAVQEREQVNESHINADVQPELAQRSTEPTLPLVPGEGLVDPEGKASVGNVLEPTDIAPVIDSDVEDAVLETSPIEGPVASPVVSVDPLLQPQENEIVAPKVIPDPETPKQLPPVTLQSLDQLLLVFDDEAKTWQRVSEDGELVSGNFIQGLPAFRSKLDIGKEFAMTLVDGSRLQLGPEADISLDDGKLVLQNRKPHVTQTIHFRGRVLEIKLFDASSRIAIEAQHLRVPGDDATKPAHSVLRAFVSEDDAIVTVDGDVYDVTPERSLLIVDNFAPRLISDQPIPKWAVSSSSISSADAAAIRHWSGRLETIDDVQGWLKLRARTRRYNERALAARCLAEIYEFGPIVSALNDPEQHAFWSPHFATLRRVVARDPNAADLLHHAFETVHGETADFMMDMIRGYSATQLQAGAAEKLVRYLSANSLDLRVMAFQTLKDVTGYTQNFRPEKPIKSRVGSVRRWQGRLAQGKIVYREPPAIVTMLDRYKLPDESN